MNKINVVVKKTFLDRYTGQIRKAGEKMTVTYDRLSEIRRSGDYVDIAKPTPTEKK